MPGQISASRSNVGPAVGRIRRAGGAEPAGLTVGRVWRRNRLAPAFGRETSPSPRPFYPPAPGALPVAELRYVVTPTHPPGRGMSSQGGRSRNMPAAGSCMSAARVVTRTVASSKSISPATNTSPARSNRPRPNPDRLRSAPSRSSTSNFTTRLARPLTLPKSWARDQIRQRVRGRIEQRCCRLTARYWRDSAAAVDLCRRRCQASRRTGRSVARLPRGVATAAVRWPRGRPHIRLAREPRRAENVTSRCQHPPRLPSQFLPHRHHCQGSTTPSRIRPRFGSRASMDGTITPVWMQRVSANAFDPFKDICVSFSLPGRQVVQSAT